MFETLAIKRSPVLVALRWICVFGLGAYLLIGMIATYRAWFQVRSLNLVAPDSVLRTGSPIRTDVVSYARTPVDVTVELIQNTHVETVAVQHVPDNEWAFFDPRNQRASQTTILSADIVNRFQPGPIQVRAKAVGRPQWMRLPPPIVREINTHIQRD